MELYLFSCFFIAFVSCVIIRLLFSNSAASLMAASAMYLSVSHWIRQSDYNAPELDAVHIQLEYLVAFLVLFGANFLIDKFVRSIFASDIHLKINDQRIFMDARIKIITIAWFFALLITSILGLNLLYGGWGDDSGFYSSWVSNVIFFTLVGVAVAVVSLRLPHSESFPNRLAILFSGASGPAVDSLSDKVRSLGFIYSSILREIFIEEYSKKYDAYRCYVKIESSMANLFGDVDATDKMRFNITPDKFPGRNKPNPLGNLVSIYVDDKEEILAEKREIEEDGIDLEQEFTVGSDDRTFTLEYWIWIKVGEPMIYRPSRFCKEANCEIVNRLENHAGPLKLSYGENDKEEEISYGKRIALDTSYNLSPGDRVKVMCLLAPNHD